MIQPKEHFGKQIKHEPTKHLKGVTPDYFVHRNNN